MFSTIQGVEVVGMAAAVASRWELLSEISDEDGKTIEKFAKKIGVEGRWPASPRQTASDFCYAAADKLLEQQGLDRKQIGVVVFVTQTADYRVPATACVLQNRLGLSSDCLAFDVNLGCSGFVYGINVASSVLSASGAEYGLLLAGDTSAREFHAEGSEKLGHTASLLFGDAGTATLLKKSESAPDIVTSCQTDGGSFKAIIQPYGGWRNPDSPDGRVHYSAQDDIAVFNFATSKAPEQINGYMDETGTTPADYDCLVLHQANLMILKRIAKKTGFDVEKLPLSLDRFGNTSCSSIPLTLVDRYGEASGGEVSALCSGFGVGLSWGTVGLRIRKDDILPLVHTDEYYSDGYNIEDIK